MDVELRRDLLGLRLAAEALHEPASMRTTLFSSSTMCTGIRILRALSVIARVTACRIHHVA